jgi:hypothetical protein
MNIEQSRILLQQLGGIGLLKLMIGAKDFTYDSTGETGLRFKFELSAVANMVEIKLVNDLYTMNFYKIEPLMSKDENGNLTINPKADFDPQPVETYEGVYDDQLVDLFEETTRLTIRKIKLVAA